jgi:predicted membrane protein
MSERLSIHEPVLVNTIGHSAAAVIFGILLALFILNLRRAGAKQSVLPVFACALALLWNIGSLVALGLGASGGFGAGLFGASLVVALSFSVMSFLPAVLLNIALGTNTRPLVLAGYGLSTVAALLHLAEPFTGSGRLFNAGLLVVIWGFGAITAFSVAIRIGRESWRDTGSRLAASMVLFLFAISFLHFDSAAHDAWAGEIALHHAGLPLALLVLLQDYRFLLLDTFIRFLVNASLAAGFVLLTVFVVESPLLARHHEHPFDVGLLFVAACLLIVLFVYLRNTIQQLVTRVLFLRENVDGAFHELRDLGRAMHDEDAYLGEACLSIARFLRAETYEAVRERGLTYLDEKPDWVQASVPIRLSRGEGRILMFGARRGGRRYLSEDYAILGRLAAAVGEQIEQIRSAEMQNLVKQAEIRALQSQINPHFLFNSLNTLYGTIPRESSEARRLVLNLAEVFRYFLQTERPFIRVEEEIRIVRAYLAIEELRLGERLRVEFDIDEDAARASIPALSIQPLVENAVKHGVSAQPGAGFVKVRVAAEGEEVRIDVSNSGSFEAPTAERKGAGIGLENVRRRLELCYGPSARINVAVAEQVAGQVAGQITTVGFRVPGTAVSAVAV